MAEDPPELFSTLISAAAILSGSSEHKTQSPDVVTVLKSRLVRTFEILQQDGLEDVSGGNLRDMQFMTAKESLCLVERIQGLLDPDDAPPSGSGSSPPLLGTRDLSHVRTLLSIIFKWAVMPLVSELELTLPGRKAGSKTDEGSGIIDLTESRKVDYEELPAVTLRLLKLPFGTTKIRQTWITSTIFSQHAVDMLTPCLVIGWAPTPISDTFIHHAKNVKALALRFLKVYVSLFYHLCLN